MNKRPLQNKNHNNLSPKCKIVDFSHLQQNLLAVLLDFLPINTELQDFHSNYTVLQHLEYFVGIHQSLRTVLLFLTISKLYLRGHEELRPNIPNKGDKSNLYRKKLHNNILY